MKTFRVILPGRVLGLLFSEFLLCYACYLVACILLEPNPADYLQNQRGYFRLLLVSVSVLLGLFVNNLYAKDRVTSRISLVLRLTNVIGLALVVQGLLAYVPSGLTAPRLVMFVGSGLVFITLGLFRIFYSSVVLKVIGTRNIVFLGADGVLEEIAQRVRERPELGFRIAGYIADSDDSLEGLFPTPLGERLGGFDDLAPIMNRLRPDRLVVGRLRRGFDAAIPDLLTMARKGLMIEESPSVYEDFCGRVCSREMRPSQLIFENELATRPGSMALQSIYTNLLALVAIVLTSPLLICIALAVKLTSQGPLLQPDSRIGLHGIPFSLHRFRCHTSGSGNSLAERLTPVGRWLRLSQLDKLPRVFNLLRGEISLIGPRPERPEFADELSRYFLFYHQRHSVKPGILGWSQIHTADLDVKVDSLRQLEYDLYYTKHISLPLDAYILLHGVRSLLPFARHSR